jgi:hypothetical protein
MILSMLVVIGTNPTVDVSTAVGPFRTYDKALAISSELDAKGYITEICELMRVEDVEMSGAWDNE